MLTLDIKLPVRPDPLLVVGCLWLSARIGWALWLRPGRLRPSPARCRDVLAAEVSYLRRWMLREVELPGALALLAVAGALALVSPPLWLKASWLAAALALAPALYLLGLLHSVAHGDGPAAVLRRADILESRAGSARGRPLHSLHRNCLAYAGLPQGARFLRELEGRLVNCEAFSRVPLPRGRLLAALACGLLALLAAATAPPAGTEALAQSGASPAAPPPEAPPAEAAAKAAPPPPPAAPAPAPAPDEGSSEGAGRPAAKGKAGDLLATGAAPGSASGTAHGGKSAPGGKESAPGGKDSAGPPSTPSGKGPAAPRAPGAKDPVAAGPPRTSPRTGSVAGAPPPAAGGMAKPGGTRPKGGGGAGAASPGGAGATAGRGAAGSDDTAGRGAAGAPGAAGPPSVAGAGGVPEGGPAGGITAGRGEASGGIAAAAPGGGGGEARPPPPGTVPGRAPRVDPGGVSGPVPGTPAASGGQEGSAAPSGSEAPRASSAPGGAVARPPPAASRQPPAAGVVAVARPSGPRGERGEGPLDLPGGPSGEAPGQEGAAGRDAPGSGPRIELRGKSEGAGRGELGEKTAAPPAGSRPRLPERTHLVLQPEDVQVEEKDPVARQIVPAPYRRSVKAVLEAGR